MAALGELVVSLSADTARFTSDLGKAAMQADRRMESIRATATKVGRMAGVALAGAATGFAAIVKASATAADEMGKAAQAAGVSTETFSELAYASDLAGVSQEGLSTAIKQVNKTLYDAVTGSKEASDTLKALGVEARNTDGSLKSADQVIEEVADRFAQMEAGAEKSALAVKLFGRAGADLIPLLNGGAKAIRQAREEAQKFGLSVSDEFAKQAEVFNDNLTRLQGATKGLGYTLANWAIPYVNQFAERMTVAAKASANFWEFLRLGTISIGDAGEKIKSLMAERARLREDRNWEPVYRSERLKSIEKELSMLREIQSMDALRPHEGKIYDKYGYPALIKPPALPSDGGSGGTKAATDDVTEAIMRQVKALQIQSDTLGMTAREAELYRLQMDGANEIQLAVADGFLQTIEDGESWIETQRRIAEVTEQTLTPVERFNQDVTELNKLLAAGLSDTAYSRMLDKLQKDLVATSGAAEDTKDTISEFALEAARNIQDSIGDTLFNILQGKFDSIGDSFKAMLDRMVAEALAAQLAQKMFGDFATTGKIGGWAGDLLGSLGGIFSGTRAGGGDVLGGRSYLVGENGPELVTMGASGTVTPNDRLGNRYFLTVNMPESSTQNRQTAMQFGRMAGSEIQRALRRNG